MRPSWTNCCLHMGCLQMRIYNQFPVFEYRTNESFTFATCQHVVTTDVKITIKKLTKCRLVDIGCYFYFYAKLYVISLGANMVVPSDNFPIQ